MECNKCGYCCIRYDVIVPVDPDKGFVAGNLTHKPSGKMCHHSLPDGTCAIHEKDYYKNMSCFHYDYGDGNLCETTPGEATASQLRKVYPRHDPYRPSAFEQEIMLLLNAEMAKKNMDEKRKREENGRG